ncbi:bacterial type II secretion system domain protein F [Gleimia coleocanis DSM 15436]|uniref:Bacterial type II secretion system domain protein F n=1 Tax=Gleimia coleocanis DSM 15436 TaxID=525245 RepID=C0VZP8_9ACTO|nr:type II secretion system F family protein [Gleimia coleocanis]EEH63757.1 bacterial type II secretion system domain protein F [Gleimia coleocanis DSM 15436]
MSLTTLPIITGLLLGVGMILCVEVIRNRPRELETRVFIYLCVPKETAPSSRISHSLDFLTPLWNALGSTNESVRARLETLGNSQEVSGFRLIQVATATFGALLIGLAIIFGKAGNLTVLQWLLITSISFTLITVGWDKLLTYRVNTFSKKLNSQVADAAELLALVISAGESVPGALNRVAKVSGPQMASQLESALTQIAQGTAVSKALKTLANKTPSVQLQRLLNTLVSGMERGSSLSEILRHQAKDLREESLRNLLESGGRKEIAMLIPVVFLILPVTVIFALYPGLIALKF